MKKPFIVPNKNGPLYFIYDPEPKGIDLLENSRGEKVSNVKSVALCRCGGSKNKPFCDGTHAKNGFSSARETNGDSNHRIDYAGKEVTIHDNRGICAHASECSKNSPDVFGGDKKPWIDPNGESGDQIIQTILKCPSGALSYSEKGTEHRDRDTPVKVIVSKNGPYYIQGGIGLMGAVWGEGASQEHYTLCRCGRSHNKPFCDGRHKPEHGGAPGFIDEKN